MSKFIKFLSSLWTHIVIGLIFWIVPYVLLYSSGRILDPSSCIVGAFVSAGVSCFDFGLNKLELKC